MRTNPVLAGFTVPETAHPRSRWVSTHDAGSGLLEGRLVALDKLSFSKLDEYQSYTKTSGSTNEQYISRTAVSTMLCQIPGRHVPNWEAVEVDHHTVCRSSCWETKLVCFPFNIGASVASELVRFDSVRVLVES